ncbi:MAG: hypothetical protein A2057_11160 [Ignavibacteria bacterium GWA2_35_9]|nr:MAG: hypothetical protein A2057_11160 [Ignavibacteria bacterium GWA2_35_9]OGU46049.1 MAG: hypothetical protein A2000_05425 [Ignavibacteria bacterium GWB2_36_8]OGU48362.1 MAG: hypothetical protein A2080_10510 [Ignavibacteria bacterium GWC2_36_12]OGV09815.1 MAG: hypothetical protein A2330_02425 [Ignavibacteria bacterium RIFOXYB2_FULL_36_7]
MKSRKLKQDFLRLIGQYLISIAANVLCKTLSVTVKNSEFLEELAKENKNFIVAFWHGTMLLPWYLHRNKNIAALISKSKDGDLLARLLKSWNYQVIRGSSSSGGEIALGIMIDFAKNKNSIAITPDGPRGPAKKLKAGAVVTAKKSGLPLVLIGVGYRNKRILRNWDNFQIPAFFSKANAVYSQPVYIDKNLDYNGTSEMINICEAKLNELQAEAERF